MDKVYKILERKLEENREEIRIEFKEHIHPIFQAHFPQKPLLPGFLLIDIVAELYNHKIIEIIQAKFIEPIVPKDIIVCSLESVASAIIMNTKQIKYKENIKIYKNNKKISEIIYARE